MWLGRLRWILSSYLGREENHGESSDGGASIRGSARTSLGDGDGGGPVQFHWGARSLDRRSPSLV